MLLLFLALPAIVAGLPSVDSRQDNIHHLPFVRHTFHRRDDFVDVGRLASSADSLRSKYGFKTADKLERRSSEGDIDVINQGGDVRYLATVSAGTPPQDLNVILDTGSADLWFATTECQTCSSTTPRFNTTKSSTLNASSTETVKLIYGTGLNATGTVLQDTVSVGPFTVPDQLFTGVTGVNGPNGLINGSIAGIFGLAFQGIAYSGATPFWQSLFNTGDFNNPEFSLYFTRFFGRVNDTIEENPGGILTLGGTNSSLYQGDIEYIPFNNTIPANNTQRTFWFQTVSDLTVNGKPVTVETNSTLAVIDSGSALIAGPTAAIQDFWGQVDGSQALTELPGFYGFPCATNVTLTISFGGTAWPIPADDVNVGQIAEGTCVGSVFDAQQGLTLSPDFPSWLFGDILLKNVYSVFRAGDNPAVGFAKLADGLRN